jgi:amino acid transporter
LLYTVIVFALAINFNFLWNAILSTVGRLLTYGIVCASLIALRSRRPLANAFRLPAGRFFAILGIGFCILLVMQMNRTHFLIVLVLFAVALLHWIFARRGAHSAPSEP